MRTPPSGWPCNNVLGKAGTHVQCATQRALCLCSCSCGRSKHRRDVDSACNYRGMKPGCPHDTRRSERRPTKRVCGVNLRVSRPQPMRQSTSQRDEWCDSVTSFPGPGKSRAEQQAARAPRHEVSFMRAHTRAECRDATSDRTPAPRAARRVTAAAGANACRLAASGGAMTLTCSTHDAAFQTRAG